MKNLVAVALAAILFPGCISTHKYASFVQRYYRNSADTPAHKGIAGITVIPSFPADKDTVVTVKKGDTYCIPAIVYWGIKESFDCELNRDIPARIFTSTVYAYSDSAGLREKLGGHRLEISIDQVPYQFEYVDKGSVVYFVFFAISVFKQGITFRNNNLSVSYKVYDGLSLIKQGKVSVSNDDWTYGNNHKSTRKVTAMCLREYDGRMKGLTRRCLVKLAGQL